MLRIQCPQIALAMSTIAVAVNAPETGKLIVPADPLNVSLAFSSVYGNGDTWIAPNDVIGGSASQYRLSTSTSREPNPVLLVDDCWNGFATRQWTADNQTVAGIIVVSVSKLQCAALILASSPLPATLASKFGTVPPGKWIYSDIDAGAEQFELRTEDGDAVVQEWYCWPIGSVAVPVNVIQSFDPPPIPATVDTYSQLAIQMPSLPREGRKALDTLLARARLYEEPTHETQDNDTEG